MKVVYFHICCINNWEEIVTKLVHEIVTSGLYDEVCVLKCGILSQQHDHSRHVLNKILNRYPKFSIINDVICTDMSLYERYTLHTLINDVDMMEEDYNILYIHSKGVSHNGKNVCVTDWVEYLTYFNITRFEDCIKKLASYDGVGVNFHSNHFSGYWDPEFWIASNSEGRFFSFFNTGINHYDQRFKPHQYRQPFHQELEIRYGISFNNSVDVTQLCFQNLSSWKSDNNQERVITIAAESMNHVFGDPFPNTHKKIYISCNGDNVGEFNETEQVVVPFYCK